MAFADTAGLMSDILNQFEDTQGWAETGSTGYIALKELALAELNSDMAYAQNGTSAALLYNEALFGQAVSQAAIRRAFGPTLRQFAADTSHPAPGSATFSALWDWLFDYMQKQGTPQTVKERNFTWGSVSAGGSNVGEATVIRCYIDEHGYEREAWTADTYTVECVEDATTAGRQPGQEKYLITGTGAPRSNLYEAGSSLRQYLIGKTAKDSERNLVNPSFDRFSGTAAVGSPAAPTAVAGWTVGSSWSNFNITLDEVYRYAPGKSSTTSAALEFTTNDSIKQNLITTRKVSLKADRPYLIRSKVKRKNSCDGTLTIRLDQEGQSGGVSRAVTMTGLTNSDWNEVMLVSSPGANNWLRNFTDTDLTLSFTLASHTTGSLVLDDIDFFEFDLVGGSRHGRGTPGIYMVVVGHETAPVIGDTFSFTDSISSDSVNQKWLALGGFGYLPASATPTIADS